MYMYTKKKNIPYDTWLTQSHLKLDYENFACDSSRLGVWLYAENPGAVIHGFHDTQLNSSLLWLFRWSYMYSFDYWISCRHASITVSCNTFKAPWTDFQWVMSTFLTCTMSCDEPCRDESGWVGGRACQGESMIGFTVMTPPRYNAPDMTPPTTGHNAPYYQDISPPSWVKNLSEMRVRV